MPICAASLTRPPVIRCCYSAALFGALSARAFDPGGSAGDAVAARLRRPPTESPDQPGVRFVAREGAKNGSSVRPSPGADRPAATSVAVQYRSTLREAVDEEPRSGWPAPDPISRATERRWSDRRSGWPAPDPVSRATEFRVSDPKPYSRAVERWAAAACLVLLAVSAVLFVLTTWTNGDWTAFDDSIECDDSLQYVLFYFAFAMWLGAVIVFALGLVRAIDSRSWASTLVCFAGVCLFVCGVACANLAVQVSYAAACD